MSEEAKASPRPDPDYMLYPRRHRSGRILLSARSDGNARGLASTRASDEEAPPHGSSAARLPAPTSASKLAAIDEWLNRLSAMAWLGGRFELSERDIRPHVSRREGDGHRGGMGTSAVNGATIAALIDCAVGAAGIIYFGGTSPGTINLGLNVLAPMFSGAICVRAWTMRRTALFVEAVVTDRHGRMRVTGSGIVAKIFSTSACAEARRGETP